MESTVITWLPQFFETIRTIAIALIPIIILWFQFKSKRMDKKFEIQFRAKEYLFKVYQDEIKEASDSIGNFNEAMGKLIGTAIGIDDAEERIKYLSGLRSALNMLKSLMQDAIGESEDDLKENDLLDEKSIEKINYIKKIIEVEINEIPVDQIENLLVEYTKVNILFNYLDKTISRKKRDELFKNILEIDLQ
jgi:hypothetical protein